MRFSPPWWRTDDYDEQEPLPEVLKPYVGPMDSALVQVFGEKTQKGWGLHGPRDEHGFMPRYVAGEFSPRKALHPYNKHNQPFAFIMRSLKLLVLDIDGKNGGFDGAVTLGNLPYTLAETSKSGNGYHLFFTTPEDEWDPELGYAQYEDRIGFAQGVDIRSVGCVFHHSTQRWNGRSIAPLPDYIAEKLNVQRQSRLAAADRIQKVKNEGDVMETLLLHDELTKKLDLPIPAGRRNTTLFAIGQQMKAAGMDDWPTLIEARAQGLGLPDEETDKLVANIRRYDA